MLPAKGLHFEIWTLWSMTESIIHPEPFLKFFSIINVTVVLVGLNILPMSLSLINVSAFEFE